MVWGMGKDGGQWEVEDEEGGQNQRGKQEEWRKRWGGDKKRKDKETVRWTWMTGGTEKH